MKRSGVTMFETRSCRRPKIQTERVAVVSLPTQCSAIGNESSPSPVNPASGRHRPAGKFISIRSSSRVCSRGLRVSAYARSPTRPSSLTLVGKMICRPSGLAAVATSPTDACREICTAPPSAVYR